MSDPTKESISPSDRVVEYILTLRIEQFESLSVKSIARYIDISENRLWRRFKKEKNMTLEEYLFRMKVTHAAFLLQEKPDITVKQVAEMMGYYCYDYFIRIFKEYFGITPGKYRELKKLSRDASKAGRISVNSQGRKLG